LRGGEQFGGVTESSHARTLGRAGMRAVTGRMRVSANARAIHYAARYSRSFHRTRRPRTIAPSAM
jgi:hypothetical protein